MRKSYVALLKKLEREGLSKVPPGGAVGSTESSPGGAPLTMAEFIRQMPLDELEKKLGGVLVAIVAFGGSEEKDALKARLRIPDDIAFKAFVGRTLREKGLTLAQWMWTIAGK